MNQNNLLKVEEFALSLRITPACVRRWIREEKVVSVHIGRLVRVPESEVSRIISQGTRPARPQRRSREASRGGEK